MSEGKESARQLSAEFLGTLVLMVFGLGVNAQTSFLSGEGDAKFFWVHVGWGMAVMFGVYACAKVSGAHLNPAVTIALALRRKFAWNMVLPYIMIQLSAAIVASVIVYGVYNEAIAGYEAKIKVAQERVLKLRSDTTPKNVRPLESAKMFGTYPREVAYLPEGNSFLLSMRDISIKSGLIDQIVGTALLLLCICALTDKRNAAPADSLAPPIIGASVFTIGLTFGYNCGYAINPARDFGPRLFTYFAGWGDQVFTAGNNFCWVPVVGPIIGGIVGVLIYDLFVFIQHPKDDKLL